MSAGATTLIAVPSSIRDALNCASRFSDCLHALTPVKRERSRRAPARRALDHKENSVFFRASPGNAPPLDTLWRRLKIEGNAFVDRAYGGGQSDLRQVAPIDDKLFGLLEGPREAPGSLIRERLVYLWILWRGVLSHPFSMGYERNLDALATAGMTRMRRAWRRNGSQVAAAQRA